MARPPLLVIDPDAGRRNGLSQGLAEAGYEVVPAVTATEGLRFARSLDSAVLVADSGLPEAVDGSLFDNLGDGKAVVLLGVPQGDSNLDADISFIPTGVGLSIEDLCRKLRLVLIGREIGVDADSRCEALVGDLSLTPLADLLRDAGEARFSGCLELERGAIYLAQGEVVASESAPVRGRKAFCRLSRWSSGPFRLMPSTDEVRREITDDVASLLVAAIEDSMGEFPDPRTRIEIEIGPDFFARELTEGQKHIVQVAQKGASLQDVLDASPEPDGAVMDDLLRLAERGIAVFVEPQAAVVVMTDSTSDLPAHVALEHGITVVPLKVHFGKKVFRDGVDLEPRRFYELLEKKGAHPTTEPPSADEFAASFREPFTRADIVSIHLSSRMSATLQHAGEAAQRLLAEADRHPARLEVIDSRAVSMALGWEAIFAARMAWRGESAPTIRERLRKITPRLQMLFVVDTLDFLVRGGRIGKARGLIGKLLGIKPILGVKAGEVVAVDRVRGGRAAQQLLIKLMAERLEEDRPTVVAVIHAKVPARANRVARLLRERFTVSELKVTEIGPVVGTHLGPGAVGIMGFQPTAEEAALIAPLREGSSSASRSA